MRLALLLWLSCLPSQDISVQIPPGIVPEHTNVEVNVRQGMDPFNDASVTAVGRKYFEPVQVYKTTTDGLWVFTGPADEYLITVYAVSEGGTPVVEQIKLTIGPRAPPGPGPGPTPPDETEVPEDRFDNVGRLSFQKSAGLEGQTAVATTIRAEARKLIDGTYINNQQALDALSVPESYTAWLAAIQEAINNQWNTFQTRRDFSEFLEAVATGLEAHKK